MSLYEHNLPAPTVFELLSFNVYEKGGCFSKIHKIIKKFLCLIDIKDNSKLNIHAKFQFNMGSSSGSMKCWIFERGFPKFCFAVFSKSNDAFVLKFCTLLSYAHLDLIRFWRESFKGLGMCRGWSLKYPFTHNLYIFRRICKQFDD